MTWKCDAPPPPGEASGKFLGLRAPGGPGRVWWQAVQGWGAPGSEAAGAVTVAAGDVAAGKSA
jgi:hypothetical protein